MGTMENAGVSRRNFLQGAGLMGMGVAAATMMAACSPSSGSSKESASEAAAAAEETGSGYVAGSSSWLGEKPEIADSDIVETVECDVAVCGGGHAGIQAALAAAEGGAKVAVIE